MLQKLIKIALLTILVNCLNMSIVKAQCPSVISKYKDIEQWMHTGATGRHTYEVQVTIINPAGHTVFGKGCVSVGVSPYGQCNLTTNPSIGMLFSDRTTSSLTPNASNQPFSVGKTKIDQEVISLDMVNNSIIRKSITWNYTTTFSNAIRNGNVIYAVNNEGIMIILNLKALDVDRGKYICDKY
jgi:hypothetical protein